MFKTREELADEYVEEFVPVFEDTAHTSLNVARSAFLAGFSAGELRQCYTNNSLCEICENELVGNHFSFAILPENGKIACNSCTSTYYQSK